MFIIHGDYDCGKRFYPVTLFQRTTNNSNNSKALFHNFLTFFAKLDGLLPSLSLAAFSPVTPWFMIPECTRKRLTRPPNA